MAQVTRVWWRRMARSERTRKYAQPTVARPGLVVSGRTGLWRLEAGCAHAVCSPRSVRALSVTRVRASLLLPRRSRPMANSEPMPRLLVADARGLRVRPG
ncbi:hypothetical protein GCM10023257_03650 [Streptomyces hyderabadensis]|uniref:Uncharacterized protein n=1 Tax=Streptomyces hyderabadensis TaxID=598549 RepID=A0ABP9HH80_9ACTN